LPIACGLTVQSIVGAWIDEIHHKRLVTAIAAVTVALGAVGIVALPSYGLQVVVQLIIGLAVTVFPAATAAFALGMVDRDQLSMRVARNETFTHTGNVAFAIAAGAVGTLLALQGIFFAAAVFAIGMAPSVLLIQREHVSAVSDEDAGDEAGHRIETGAKNTAYRCVGSACVGSDPIVTSAASIHATNRRYRSQARPTRHSALPDRPPQCGYWSLPVAGVPVRQSARILSAAQNLLCVSSGATT